MKHIKKRYWNEVEVPKRLEKPGVGQLPFDLLRNQENLRKAEGKMIYLVKKSDNKSFECFIHKVDNKKFYAIPVPDPTLIYFHNAQECIALIAKNKLELLDKIDLNGERIFNEDMIEDVSKFFSYTSIFAVFLFMSLESFLNQNFPAHYSFHAKDGSVLDKEGIQRNLDFITKIKVAFPEALGKKFCSAKNSMSNIFLLHKFRNSIIHTKQDMNKPEYVQLLQTTLDFKYENTLEEVANFMNFYKSEYIVACDCGAEH